MATTYYSTEITRGDQPRYVESGDFTVWGTFSLTAALVINDVIQMCKVPNGARILNIDLYCDDLDTNGTPLIALDVGDGGSVNRFAQAVLIAENGGIMRGIQTKAGFGYQYSLAANTGYDTIDIKVNTAPATGATTGDIKMRVTMCVDC